MKIEIAIEKAIEIGYDPKRERLDGCGCVEFTGEAPVKIHQTLLDPNFWKALGKSEGWEFTKQFCKCGCNGNNCSLRHCDENCHLLNKPIKDWKVAMHKFIDNLAQGQDLETAFDNATK